LLLVIVIAIKEHKLEVPKIVGISECLPVLSDYPLSIIEAKVVLQGKEAEEKKRFTSELKPEPCQ